jgi:hypothetical protein
MSTSHLAEHRGRATAHHFLPPNAQLTKPYYPSKGATCIPNYPSAVAPPGPLCTREARKVQVPSGYPFPQIVPARHAPLHHATPSCSDSAPPLCGWDSICADPAIARPMIPTGSGLARAWHVTCLETGWARADRTEGRPCGCLPASFGGYSNVLRSPFPCHAVSCGSPVVNSPLPV